MVECIAEVFRLVLSHRIVVVVTVVEAVAVALAALATLRTRTALTTLTTLGTGTTLATLRTRTALTLYISLGLRNEYTVRELILTRLLVNLHQLHGDLVAFLQTSLLDGLQALPVNLRDV